ncbi:amidase signature enzyme, partial [Teratosphaeria nubilosa]
WSAFALDSGTEIHTHLRASNEPPTPELAISYGANPRHLPTQTIHDAWALQTRKQAFQRLYNDYWRSTGVDAVIMPVAPTASHKRGEGRYFGYTGVWNVLDYAAVALKTTTRAVRGRDWLGDECGGAVLGDLDEEVKGQYDAEVFHGMPVGVQLVCQRLEEEKLLAIAEEVQRILLTPTAPSGFLKLS